MKENNAKKRNVGSLTLIFFCLFCFLGSCGKTKSDSDKAVETFIQALKDKNHRVRLAAVTSLRKLKSERAVESLVQALMDEDDEVRTVAVAALKEIKSKKAIEPLIRILKSKDRDGRFSAIKVLGDLGSEKAIVPLLQIIKSEDPLESFFASIALEKISSKIKNTDDKKKGGNDFQQKQ